MKLILNASMPRSGSELLQALLNQHPAIKAGGISPMLEYAYGALGNSNVEEARSQPEDIREERMQAFVSGGINAYADAALATKPGATVYADKSRGWMQYAEVAWSVDPEAKLVICERSMEGVLDSFEKAYQANIGSAEVRHLPVTAEGRKKYWLNNRPYSLALARLKERLAVSKYDDRVIRFNYEDLVKSPVAVMSWLFEKCGLEDFKIDPNNVEKAEAEKENAFGIFGDHNVIPQVVSDNQQAKRQPTG